MKQNNPATLREQILAALLTAEGYCSGAELAERFGVSRTAVWKCMEQLKEAGCTIEAATNRGYRLTDMPDLFCVPYFQTLVQGCRIPWQVQHLTETDSTNTVAKRLAAEGAPEGTVIVADRQTSGKGRLGRSFHAPMGGLYLSLVIRPELPLIDMMKVTACAASAVYCALQDVGVTAQIKWVNDLFLNGRKICGILTESSFNAELMTPDYLVIGIGINLHPAPHLPEVLKPILTDLTTETGSAPLRCVLSAGILRHLEAYLSGIQAHTFLDVYRDNSCTIGRRVRVMLNGVPCEALAVGFAEDAGLIVRCDDGSEHTIRTGSAEIL